MSFVKELRSWLFRDGAPINPDVDGNLKDHLKQRGAPSQNTFERFTASVPFFKEADDRAKLSTGGAIENEVGLVTVAPDTDVVNAGVYVGNTGLAADRTKVVHAAQLSTVDATESQTVGALADNLVEVTVDGAVTTRNNFLLRLKESFRAWLDTLRSDVDTNTTNIATNTANIATNASDIATNATNIATNTANISTNTTDIATNTANIATNTSNIATNTSDIAANTAAIATAVTTTWSTLSTSEITVSRAAGAGGTYAIVGTPSGSIRYMVLDKTVFLSVSVGGIVISSTGTRTYGADYARLGIDLSSIGVVSNNQSISTFNASYNSGSPISFDVASSSSGGDIHNVQGLQMPGGSANTASFVVRGMIAVQIN
jgi:hypothetical protein